MEDKIKRLLSGFKNGKLIVALGIAGILLIFISSLFSPADKEETQKTEAEVGSVAEYKEELQRDIEAVVKKITGSKNVKVVITLDTGFTYNYADEVRENTSNRQGENTTDTSTDSQNSFIIVKDSSGNERALVVNENLPQIRGVAVVYDGYETEAKNEKIKNALMATLSVTSKRIYISGEGGNIN